MVARLLTACLAVVACLPAQAPVELSPQSCGLESALRSEASDTPTSVVFLNATSQDVKVYWINFTSQRVLYQTLPAGGRYTQPTFLTHPWVITDSNDRCLTVFFPLPRQALARITARALVLSQTGFTFQAAPGGAASSQSLRVLSDFGPLNWTVSSGAPWLTFTPASGTTDATRPTPTVTVTANPSGLAPGAYYALLQVASPEAINSPQSATVVLEVLPAGVQPGPAVEPAGLVFVGATAQTVRAVNRSTRAVTVTSTASFPGGPAWFSRQPAGGTIAPGQALTLTVQPNLTGLAAGVYRGELALRFAEDGITNNVSLILIVTAAPAPRAIAQAACVPTRLLPVFTLLGSNFTVTAGWPTPLEALVVDDCGRSLTNGSVIASFSNQDPPLPLSPLLDGRWSGTWPPRNARSPELTVTVRAQQPDRNLEGAAENRGFVQINLDVPLVFAGGVVSAASYAAAPGPAPGSFVAIFGSGLAGGTDVSARLPLETRLADTLITVAGRPLPLLFVSPGQVNAQIPYSVASAARQQMIVRRGDRLSVPEPVPVVVAQPSVFTVDQSGRGQGHIYRATTAGTQILADPASPVSAGDVLVIYCSGLGPVAPPLDAGAAAPLTVLTRTANPVSLTIGGQSAEVLFAGLTAGFAGLYQVNTVVPSGVAGGGQVPVVLTVASQSSPPVTIAVR